MANIYPNTPVPAEQDNVDLVHRYCPGLESHTPNQIERYIPDDPTMCWLWSRYTNPQGYGLVTTVPTPYGYARPVAIHRYMYDALVGEVDPQHHVHHKCHKRGCWNPFHLEALTPREHTGRHRI